jgi:hypothetical protein
MKISHQMKQKFFDEGHVLPMCINPGCVRQVRVRNWKDWSLKSECGTCYKARSTGFFGPAMAGITIHKKDHCENVDGRLGWKCPVPSETWIELDMLNALDLEHLDGNHFNNTPKNVDTICKLCHGKKSTINNDFSNKKDSARRIVH